MLHLNFDILDWCSKDYVPALNQSTESLWTWSEPAECFWTCRPPADVSSSGIRPAESSLCLCVADCVAVSLRTPWSPAEATWWPSNFTRTRPTWTRVSPPSTKPLSRLIVRPDLLSFSCILQFLFSPFTVLCVRCLTVCCRRSACPGRFQCTNNLCINTTLHCDGWNDCGDGSDEDNCSESEPRAVDQTQQHVTGCFVLSVAAIQDY